MNPKIDTSPGLPVGNVTNRNVDPIFDPVLFRLYTADLSKIFGKYGMLRHIYEDDTQIYSSCCPTDADQLQYRALACIDKVPSWMEANRRQLNTAKTEVVWFATAQRQFQLPTCGIRVINDVITPSTSSLRPLSFHRLRHDHADVCIHNCVPIFCCSMTTLKCSSFRAFRCFPIADLDYGKVTVAGISACLTPHLQTVLNAAARMILRL